ncbi:Homeobox-leucine zipper protein HAT22 [Glycine soja]|nr:Homeobox-leucine zipper protein HAT22 [Glycine soja]
MGLDQDANSSGLHLVLGLSLTATVKETTQSTKPDDDHHLCVIKPTPTKPYPPNEPSLTLGLSGESYHVTKQVLRNNVYCEDPLELSRQTSPHSVVSSFSTGRVVKRERDLSCEDIEVEAEERVSSRVSDEDEDGTNARKKLRLTKEQSALLEESFKQHSTLNPKQKQALARRLNLRPRQVEVWFQNRRARTKLKQTEVDCEFLKKCCETLTDENRRLKKELQELKALKLAQPLYMPMPAATLTMCPSCERLGGVSDNGSNKSPFSMAPKPHFYNPFANPSAAC